MQRKNDIMVQLQRSFIESYFDEKIFLAAPLLKWYLVHGLIVTRVYLSAKLSLMPAVRLILTLIIKSIIADIMKLVGSSSYGKAVRRALN